MSFNLKRFLRRTPPPELRRYFYAQCNGLSAHIDWDTATPAQLDALIGAINASEKRDAVLADFEQVEHLCNPIGQTAMRSVVATNAHILSHLQGTEGDEARGLILLLQDATLFEQALAAAYADGLRYGRAWSAFNVPGPSTTCIDLQNLQRFEADIAAELVRVDGTVGKIKIDAFQRAAVGDMGTVAGPFSVQYTIYSEGLPVSDLVFQGDEPARQTRRPVFEAAIWYDQVNRTLDVVAAGGRVVRTRIAELFAGNVLGITETIGPVAMRRFALDRLKRPFTGETDPSDGIRSVKVLLLRLAPIGGGYGRVTIEVDPNNQRDICACSEEWFGDADPLRRPEWHVTQAKLRIVFYREAGRARDKTVTLELRAPNGSNLRQQIRQHQILSQKYLARWGLVADAGY